MRLVLDTNVLISALITRGTPPDELYQAWRRNVFELVTSIEQIDELVRVSRYEKLQRFLTQEDVSELTSNIGAAAILVENLPEVDYATDPADNLIIATAIAGNADFIVSGDKRHLLSLKEVEGISILTTRQAIERLEKRHDE